MKHAQNFHSYGENNSLWYYICALMHAQQALMHAQQS